ncbi:MAG: hypothetical protein KAJ95_06760 [Gammaproteobacteria bacterium]|nr:hypothetical protein [Gammaproteobacteria bacterium]
MKDYKKLKRALLIPVLLMGITGCSSYGAAKIQSLPSGAEVVNLEDDSLLGTTPVMIHWKNDREESKLITVRFHKPGYDDKVTAFWVNMRHSSRADAEKSPQAVKVELKPKK